MQRRSWCGNGSQSRPNGSRFARQTAPDAELLRVRIGPGERDAILLFEEIDGDQMIIDDLRGRKEAERRGIHAIGTLGVLRIAAKPRLLNLKDALTSLRATNFYIDQELFDRLIAEAEQ